MAIKSHTSSAIGPISTEISMTAGYINVVPSTSGRTEITIRTADTEGVSAETVNAARIEERDGRISVRVPDYTSGSMVIQTGRGVSIIQRFQTVNAPVIGAIIGSDGQVVSGGMTIGVSPITIEAAVPNGALLVISSTAADVHVTADMAAISAKTVSGIVRQN